jgi:hypothetical protein
MILKPIFSGFLFLIFVFTLLPPSYSEIIFDDDRSKVFTCKIFTYLKLNNYLSFGVGGVGSLGKFLFSGTFEYSDLGEFTNYEVVNDEFYYFLDCKKIENFHAEVGAGYDFDKFKLVSDFGIEYYTELVSNVIFSFDLGGAFKISDSLETFVVIYNRDLMSADMGYSLGFNLNLSDLSYNFVDLIKFSFDKRLLYDYVVGNIFASFKIFDSKVFVWYFNFDYKYSFGIDVPDPLYVGTDLEFGSFNINYRFNLPLYFWSNYLSLSYYF